MDSTPQTCVACSKPDAGLSLPFLTCSRCTNRTYCSHTCQELDWPTHKKACGASILDTMTDIERTFFQSLMPDDFLHHYPENLVFEILDDAYDLRVVDCVKLTPAPSESPLDGSWCEFERFLDLAEKRCGLLPGWWSREKRNECERLAAKAAQLGADAPKVNGHWVMLRYRDFLMPMKFRLLAERVYGTRVPVAW
ncbi:MAG: hypothetical protein Q9161_007628 [Pseudevernia consocians]